MSSSLPEDLLVFLDDRIPCRKQQIRQLASLLSPEVPSSQAIVLHGLEATAKSLTVSKVLESVLTLHTIIRCRECITARHLLERTVIACKNAIEDREGSGAYQAINGRCESVSVLLVQLKQLLQGQDKFVLVFDSIDRLREAPPTLLPAIARLGEIIPNLTIVLIVTAPRPRFLHLAGVPHIHFPPYDRSQSLTIVSRNPLPIFTSTGDDEDQPEDVVLERQEDDAWLWARFCGAVWDSLGKGVARDITSFENACKKLWTPFVQPIRDRTYGTRDFSRLMVRNRVLFQGETALVERLVPPAAADPLKKSLKDPYPLPYYASYLLLSAYLASYNPARTDQILFMKAHERKRRKKGGGTARGRPAKHRKIQRKLLGPQAFVMERMLAIFHAIVPHPVIYGTGDILTQIATLASSRLIVKTSVTADVLDAGTKWRVNVGGEYVKGVAKGLRFDLEGYLAE